MPLRLADTLQRKKELALQVQVCSDPGQVRRIQQEEAIDILLISSSRLYAGDKKGDPGRKRIRPDRDGKREYRAFRSPGIPISVGRGHSC